MARTLRLSLLLLLVNICATVGWGQRGCDENPETAALAAAQTCLMCNDVPIEGGTFGYTPSPLNGPWCTTIENDQFFAFIVGGTGSVSFTFTTSGSCPTGSLQVAIVDATSRNVSTCHGSVNPNNSAVVSFSGPPGSVYFLRIDGNAGTECEFTVTGTGFVDGPPDPVNQVTGPRRLCLGQTANYTIPPQQNAGYFTWQFLNIPSFLQPFLVDTSGTLGAGNNREISVTIPDAALVTAPPGCYPFQMRVRGENGCFSGQFGQPVTVEVCIPAPQVFRATICDGQSYTVPNGGGQTFNYNDASPFPFAIPLNPVNPPNSCPRVDTLYLTAAFNNIATEELVLCGTAPFTACSYNSPPGPVPDPEVIECNVPATGPGQCPTTVFYTVFRNNPVATISGNATIPCGTATTTLTAGAQPASDPNKTVTYAWTNAGGAPAGTGQTITVGPGTYTLTVSMIDTRQTAPRTACTATASVTVVGGATTPPAPVVDAPASICATDLPLTFTINSPASGRTYQWVKNTAAATGAPSASTTSYVVTALGGATSVVVCANVAGTGGANGCPASAPTCRTVTITPAPAPVTLSGPAELCAGTTGAFTIAPFNAAAGNYAVSTTGAGTSATRSGATVTVTMGSAASTVCVTPPSTGCGTPQQVCQNISLSATPTAPTPAGPATACLNSTENYSITPAPAAGTTVTWRATGGTVSGTGASVSVNWTTAGAGQVCARLQNACGNDEKCFSVTVRPQVTATITGGGAYCAGSTPPSVIINVTGGAAPYTYGYNIDGGATVTGTISTGTSATITPSGSGTFNLVSISSAGCAGTASGSAIVRENPTPTATISGTAQICSGANGQLQVVFTGGTGPWTFTPALNGTAQAPVTATSSPYTLTVTAAGTYTITNVSTGTAPNQCSGTPSGTGTVTLVPALVVGTPVYTCAQNSLTYTTAIAISGGQAPYTITPAGGTAATLAAAGTFTSQPIPSGNSVTFTITDASGCSTNVQSRTATNICSCPSEVGTLTIAPGFAFCGTTQTADASTRYNSAGEMTPAPYVRRYILSTGTNPITGIIASNTTGSFPFAAPMAVEVTYYITVVVGIPDAQGNFDFADPCTKVSASLPVVWSNPATAALSGGAEICAGANANLAINLTGTGPWTVTPIRDGVALAPITIPSSPFTYVVSAGGTYTLGNVASTNNASCTSTGTGSAVVTITPALTVSAFSNYTCSANGLTYTGTINIGGGRAPYTVTGAGAPVTVAAAGAWTTPSLASGSSQVYTVTDASGCSTQTATADFTCACPTEVGTLTINPGLSLCGTTLPADAAALYNSAGENVVAPYTRRFVLSSGTAPVSGVITSNTTGTFNLGAGMTAGTTYYITVVVGLADASGNFDYSDACTKVTASLPVVWRTPPTATIGAGSAICSGQSGTVPVTVTGSGNLTLSYTVNGGAVQTITLTAPTGNIVLPNLTADATVAITRIAGPNCSTDVTGSATVTVNEAVTATAAETCSADKTNYTVRITISGGDPSSYVVTGGMGTLSGNIWTSAPIAEGTGYSFTVTDANGCSPVVLAKATVACDCVTDAGTMPTALVQVCGNGAISVTPTTAATLDPNDVQAYYLHTGTPTSLGTILAGPQATSTFAFIPGTTAYGTTYYVSIAVGNDLNGAPDPGDRCFAVAGTPVRWNEAPTATIGQGTAICAGGDASVAVALTGSGPWTITYNINGGAPQTLNAATSPATIALSALAVNTTVTLTNVSTGSGATACAAPATGSATITINPAVTATATTACNATGDFYTVTVTLAGGDPATYGVTGGPGNLTGNVFVSDPRPAGTGYSYTATDANGCTPVVVSAANVNCDCPASSPGTMSSTLVEICGNGDAVVTASTGVMPDPDDVVGYVLHTGSSNTLGTVLVGPQLTSTFAFVAGTTMYGTTYYVSTVVANDNGSGLPDLNDACLDVNVGTPVRWISPADVVLSGDATVCPGEAVTLNFTVTGNGPVMVTYSDGTTTYTASLTTGANQVPAPTVDALTYTIVSATSGNCAATTSGTATITLLDGPIASAPRVEFSGDFTQFRIMFDISGGDPATYTVDGNSLAGATSFTSAFIACGQSYSFIVNDGGGCAPVTVSGTPSCNCRTAVGALTGTFTTCDVTATATFVYNPANEVLDADDAVQYILYTTNQLTPLFRSATPDFTFQAPMVRGVVYNIAAVAGNATAGVVDLTDACTVFSAPRTAVWYLGPDASFTAPTAICAGQPWTVVFTATGSASAKTVSYTLGGTPGQVTVTPGTPLSVDLQPTAGATLVLTQVSDANCTTPLTQSMTVDVASAIVVSNENDDNCNATNTMYRVIFEIRGGDSTTYQVLPVGSGRLTGTNPAVFTSNEIISGQPYDFRITDGSGCFEVVVSGIRDCNCTTQAGTMTTTVLQRICEGDSLTASYIRGTERLDGNDAVRFALRRRNDRVSYTDDVIAVGTRPRFGYDPAQMSPGDTLFISALAGDSTATGLDLTTGCFSIGNSTPIYISPMPTALLTGDTVICEGGTAELKIITTGEGPFDIEVEDPDGGISTIPNVSGDYIYRVDPATGSVYVLRNIIMTSSPQCASQLNSSADVGVDQLVDAGMAEDDLQLCENSGDVVQLAGQLTGADPNGRWTQTGGAPAGGNFNAATATVRNTGLTPGTYSFTYTVGGGASSVCPVDQEAIALLVEAGPVADAGLDQELTCDVTEVDLGGTRTDPGATYTWQGGVVEDDSAPRTTTREAGTYTLIVTNPALGCEGRDEVVVTASDDIPEIDNLLVRDETCFGDGDGEVSATITGGVGPFFVSLDDAPATRATRFERLAPGDHTVQITDAAGCVVERSFTVEAAKEVIVDAGPNAEIAFGENYGVRLYLEGRVETVRWTGDSVVCASGNALCDTVTLFPRASGNYTVTVRDSNGCVAKDNLQLIIRRDRPVMVPTAFSPNGDAINDIVFVQAGERVVREVKAFMIFDRWGELMHESREHVPNDPAFGWNGVHRDQMMNPQVFVYWAQVEYIDGTLETIKGDITLVR